MRRSRLGPIPWSVPGPWSEDPPNRNCPLQANSTAVCLRTHAPLHCWLACCLAIRLAVMESNNDVVACPTEAPLPRSMRACDQNRLPLWRAHACTSAREGRQRSACKHAGANS